MSSDNGIVAFVDLTLDGGHSDRPSPAGSAVANGKQHFASEQKYEISFLPDPGKLVAASRRQLASYFQLPHPQHTHVCRFVGGNGGDLDFAVSVSGTVGVWDIEWKFVACPGEAISFTFGISNPYFWSLQPRGTKTPVESLTINGQEAARDQFNYFKLAGGPWTGAQTVVTTTLAGVVQTSQVTLD